MDFLQWGFLGTVFGGALSAAIARYFIVRSLEDLKEVSNHVNSIDAKLSAIEVRLEEFGKLEDRLYSIALKKGLTRER